MKKRKAAYVEPKSGAKPLDYFHGIDVFLYSVLFLLFSFPLSSS